MGTLEWFLACVNPFMLDHIATGCERFGTALMGTLEWFLACVSPFMLAQLPASCARFGAVPVRTLERLLVQMSPSVRGEVASAVLHDERCLPYSPAVIYGAWQLSPHLHTNYTREGQE